MHDQTLLPNCWAEIDLEALRHNVSLLQKFEAETMAVLKADSYGHGTGLIAPELLKHGIVHFGVATVAEGADLRMVPDFDSAAICVMTATAPDDAAAIAQHRLIPFVSSFDSLKYLNAAALAIGSKVAVHLEVDTGIGRAGILPLDVPALIEKSLRLPGIEITGICTHFTSGEDAPDAACQYELFETVLAQLPDELLMRLMVHAANSPAALNVPGARYNIIRPGLLLYGIAPMTDIPEPWRPFPFKPVLSLKSRVILVRDLPAGAEISYGRTYKLPHPARIATIGIGYGDGYSRRLSNVGHVQLPSGVLAPIRGRVCMDQICVEVPNDEVISVGDIVTLIGDVGASSIRAADVAALISATPHEITTCLTGRVPRIAKA